MERQSSILHRKTTNGKAITGILKKGVVEWTQVQAPAHRHTETDRQTETQTGACTHACPLAPVGKKEVLIEVVTVFLTSLDI